MSSKDKIVIVPGKIEGNVYGLFDVFRIESGEITCSFHNTELDLETILKNEKKEIKLAHYVNVIENQVKYFKGDPMQNLAGMLISLNIELGKEKVSNWLKIMKDSYRQDDDSYLGIALKIAFYERIKGLQCHEQIQNMFNKNTTKSGLMKKADKHFSKAVDMYERIIRTDCKEDDKAEAYRQMIKCYINNGIYDAMPVCEVLDEDNNLIIGSDRFLQENAGEIMLDLGIALKCDEDYDLAIGLFDKALEYEPQWKVALECKLDCYEIIDDKKGVGETLIELTRYQEALSVLEGIKKKDRSVVGSIVTCCQKLSLNDKAIKYLEKL